MPASTFQIPGGARVFLFRCEVCGAPASESRNADLRKALATGNPKFAGEWFCAEHAAQARQESAA